MTRTNMLVTLCILSILAVGALTGSASAAPLELYVSPTGSIPDAFPSLTEALDYARTQDAQLTMVYLEYAHGMYDSAHEAFPLSIERTVYLQTIGDFSSASFQPEEGFAFVLSDSAKLVLSRVRIDGNNQGKGMYAETNSELVARACGFYTTTGSYLSPGPDSWRAEVARTRAEFLRCDFADNIAAQTSAGIRMQVNNPERPHLIVTDCGFYSNMSDYSPCISWFDWFYAMMGKALVSDCIFENNSGGWGPSWNPYLMGDCGILGAGSYSGRSPTERLGYIIRNCLFIDDLPDRGGVIASWGGCSSMIGSTLINDQLWRGGYYGDSMSSSVLWGREEATNWPGQHCCVQGGLEGEGNMGLDPIFVSDERGYEYLLSSTAAGQEEDSPCIDAGGVSAAEAGMQFYTTRTDFVPDTGIVDMGFHYRVAPRIVMDIEEADGAYCVLLSGGASRYVEATVDVYLAVVTPTGEILTFSAGEWTRGISPILTNVTLRTYAWHGPFFLDEIAARGDPRFSRGTHTLVAVMCHPGTLEYACEPATHETVLY